MAKTLSKSSGHRSRQTPPAKSAKTPARPAAKTVTAKPPPPTRTPPARPAPVKAPAAKVPTKKTPPAKPANARARAAVVEKSPATEEEIVSAVAGKLTARTGGGMTWLSAKAARIETVEISVEAPAPEPVIPVEAVVVEEEGPATKTPAAEAPVSVEVESPPVQDPPSPVEVEAEAPNASNETSPVNVVTAVADDSAIVGTAAPEPAAAAAPPAAVIAAKSAPAQQAFLLAVLTAARQLGWALTVQALTFIAFCVLVKGGVPTEGLPLTLAAIIPLFAIFLIVGGYLSFHGTRCLLDQLEHDRLRLDPGNPPAPLTPARLFAHQPALIILGVLLLAWFFIGVTVWWL